ncbi:MAG: M48 family metallopeptidase [Cyanobacteria bacterium P01_F01_bin.150]
MNFFEHQDNARRKTIQLVIVFVLAIALMIVSIYGIAVVALLVSDSGINRNSLWQPEILLSVTLGVIGIVGMGSLTKTLQLRGGGKVVAISLGGRLLDYQTQDELETRLLNVVKEMAIASGAPVPQVYVMDYESGINAFAAGFTINDAVIGVTRGCVEQLNRDELQGVIAHEFSHIINGDMRISLRLIGILQGLLLIHLLGREILHGIWSSGGRRRSRVDGKVAFTVIMAIALTAIGFIGFICGCMIKSAVSRQREFLADASAVQFTRNPHGIADALRKIGGFPRGSTIRNPKAEEASHLFFGEALGSKFSNLFATHPPLEERIRRLENLPDIAAVYSRTQPSSTAFTTSTAFTASTAPTASLATAAVGFAGPTPPPSTTPTPTTNQNVGLTEETQPTGHPSQLPTPNSQLPNSSMLYANPETVVTQLGIIDQAHLDYARLLLAQLPDGLKSALKTSVGAKAIIYALLLDFKDKAVRDRQVTQLKQTESSEALKTIVHMAQLVHKLNPRTRLPIVELTIPVLRNLTKVDYVRFLKQIQALVQADGHLSLSEYTLQVVLMLRLEPYFSTKPHTKITHTSIDSVWEDCLTILSGLANVGHSSLDQTTEAFQAGAERLAGSSKHEIPSQPLPANIPSIGKSLKVLMSAAPKVKQSMVDACAYTALLDGEVTVKEAELLRAIVISLGCPIPPFLGKEAA